MTGTNTVTVRKDRLNINPGMLDVPEAIVYIVREIGVPDTDFDKVRAVVVPDGRAYLGGMGAVRELRSQVRSLGQYQIIGKRYVEGDAIYGFVPNTRVPTWSVE